MKTKSAITLEKITLPARWASALINGDYSGLNDIDARKCKAQERTLAFCGWSFYDCGDPYIGQFSGLQQELADYTIGQISR